MKIILPLLIFLLSSSLVLGFTCVVGVHDMCSPECLPEGVNCEQDPHAEVKTTVQGEEYTCIFLEDGYCQPGCREEDLDCILDQKEIVEPTVEVELTYPEQESQEALFSFEERNPTTIEKILVFTGFGFLFIGLIWIVRRLEEKQDEKSYAPLIPYGQAALAQGYSHHQIEAQLQSQGYSSQFIKGYMKALVRRP